jgi:cyclase
VAVNSAAIFNPHLINQLSEEFGSQCIVIAIDAKKVDILYKSLITLTSLK